MQTIKQSIFSIAIGLALVAGISYAWEGATKNPPENNAPAPINVGDKEQIKTGPLQVNVFRNIGATVLNGNVGIGTGDKADNLFEIKSGSLYIKKDTFTCETGEIAKLYKTEPKTCGTNAGKCTKVTTISHPWSATGNNQETADYKGGSDCKEDKTCFATPYVKCQTVPQPLIKVVNGEGLSITDGSQGEGKILTSDANGRAGWAEPPSSLKSTISFYSLTANKTASGPLSLGVHDFCYISYMNEGVDGVEASDKSYQVYGGGQGNWYLTAASYNSVLTVGASCVN